jgi:hypothetical protein
MCQEAKSAYKNGIVYAIKKFALPNVSVYLDAAHSGWLGWDDNRAKIAKIFKSVLHDAGGPGMIRGFALNTANYTHLSNRDGAVLEPTNPCPNELTYAKTLGKTLEMYGFKNHGYIIDTSRNGKGNIRASGAAGATSTAQASANARASSPNRASMPISGSSRRESRTASSDPWPALRSRCAAVPTRPRARPRPASGSSPTSWTWSTTPSRRCSFSAQRKEAQSPEGKGFGF